MKSADLTRTILAVLFIGALIGASLWILRPFIGPAIWATTVVVATWPLMLRLQRRLWGLRLPAVAVMTLALLLLFVAPLTLAIATVVGNAENIAEAARTLVGVQVPLVAPSWLSGLPLVGDKIAELWTQVALAGVGGLVAKVQPYAGNVTRWMVGQVGSIGVVLLQFLATVAIAAVLYTWGELAALQVMRFARRLAGPNGDSTVRLAGDAIRGVALGVGVTAIVQAVLGGVGLALAGVPLAGPLTALMFVLCIAQIGALPVLLPAMAWAFWNGDTGWAIFLLVWSVFVGTLDNFLRPLLIRLGADLPLLLIFAGVIGGLLAFGLVGIFVGPVVLAVAYTLLATWMADAEAPDGLEAPVAPAAALGETSPLVK